MRYALLGPIEVSDDTGQNILLPPRHRSLLAALLVNANQFVPHDRLIEFVWEKAHAATAAAALRTHVMRLRRLLGPESKIQTGGGGYRIEATNEELDLLRFEALRDKGISAAHEGKWAEADKALSSALELWRDAPLRDVSSSLLWDGYVTRLDESHVRVLEWKFEVDLHLGRQDKIVPELSSLVRKYPVREHLRAQFMRALWLCGRQVEALETYQAARQSLVEELGIEPGQELRELHQCILSGAPRDPSDLLAPRVAAMHEESKSMSLDVADKWAAVICNLEALGNPTYIDLVVELHRRFYDKVAVAWGRFANDRPPGRERAIAGTLAYLDACRKQHGVTTLLESARKEPAIRAEALKCHNQMIELLVPDFAEMKWAEPADAARIWVDMVSSVALAESEATEELPRLRTSLIEFLR